MLKQVQHDSLNNIYFYKILFSYILVHINAPFSTCENPLYMFKGSLLGFVYREDFLYELKNKIEMGKNNDY